MDEKKMEAYVVSQTESFASAIEKAYAQGYNDAVEEHSQIVDDGKEYIDLGLPSGTLWTIKSPEMLPYSIAQKLNIPTLEQVKELRQYIGWEIEECSGYSKLFITDKNGKTYESYYEHYKSYSQLFISITVSGFNIWYKGSVKEENSKTYLPVFKMQENKEIIAEDEGRPHLAFFVK